VKIFPYNQYWIYCSS